MKTPIKASDTLQECLQLLTELQDLSQKITRIEEAETKYRLMTDEKLLQEKALLQQLLNESKLTASLEEPTEGGPSEDMLIDGDPDLDEPEVQELTKDDGGVEEDPTQHLLMDDLPS